MAASPEGVAGGYQEGRVPPLYALLPPGECEERMGTGGPQLFFSGGVIVNDFGGVIVNDFQLR